MDFAVLIKKLLKTTFLKTYTIFQICCTIL